MIESSVVGRQSTVVRQFWEQDRLSRAAVSGTARAQPCDVGVKKVQELLVWQRAKAFVDAVSALLCREPLRRDLPLCRQLSESSISVISNISEGFNLKTDRAFAHHLYIARGLNAEARAQIGVAFTRKHITADQHEDLEGMNEEIAKMLTGLIKHLVRENRKLRG